MKKMTKIILSILIIIFILLIAYIIYRNSKNLGLFSENNDSNNTTIESETNNNTANDNSITNQIKLTYYSGYIAEIGDNYIIVNNQEKNETQTFYADENNEFLNGRTNEMINIDTIKIGDYYGNYNKSVIRNIDGEELKKEMILNMSAGDYYYISNEVVDILNVENKGNYVIYTIEIEDVSSNSLFLKNNAKFTFKFIANENTKIYGHYDETIYNFAEYAKNQMVTIRIDRNTIDDEYPIITQMEIYDG